MADENAQANDKVEGVIIRGSAGVATTGPAGREEEAPAISMTNSPPREPPSLSGAKVSASRLYMLLHNAAGVASMHEKAHDLRTAWDDLKHHMGGVV